MGFQLYVIQREFYHRKELVILKISVDKESLIFLTGVFIAEKES